MTSVIYMFMIVWVLAAIYGIAQPAFMIKSFYSLSKILGINPDNITSKNLTFVRFVSSLSLVFGMFILLRMFAGQVRF